jgi:hypothetical protein
MISALNEDLAAISRASIENGLLLNTPASRRQFWFWILLLGMVIPSLFLGTEKIPWCYVVTDLEVVIDVRLLFDRQVTRCVRGFMPHCTDCVCWSFWRRSGSDWSSVMPCFFRISSTVMLFFSHLSSVDSRHLQVAFNWINRCTRYVFNLCRYDHLSTSRNELLGVPLFDYYIFSYILVFFFLAKMLFRDSII